MHRNSKQLSLNNCASHLFGKFPIVSLQVLSCFLHSHTTFIFSLFRVKRQVMEEKFFVPPSHLEWENGGKRASWRVIEHTVNFKSSITAEPVFKALLLITNLKNKIFKMYSEKWILGSYNLLMDISWSKKNSWDKLLAVSYSLGSQVATHSSKYNENLGLLVIGFALWELHHTHCF